MAVHANAGAISFHHGRSVGAAQLILVFCKDPWLCNHVAPLHGIHEGDDSDRTRRACGSRYYARR